MYLFPELRSRSGFTRSQESSLWDRHVRQPRTRSQIKFDVVCGVIGPLLCFIFDPIVFKSGFAGPALLPEYQTFVYLFSGIELVLLCLWLVLGPGPEFANSILGGALLAGGWMCLLIGCLLVPFSVMGLVLGVGILGFTPFVAAIVYARNGWRAIRSDAKQSSQFTRATGAVCGILLVFGISLTISIQVRAAVYKSIDDIIRADAFHASHAVQTLMVLGYFAETDLQPIVQAYRSERDEARKQLLRNCYRELTGKDLERAVPVVQD